MPQSKFGKLMRPTLIFPKGNDERSQFIPKFSSWLNCTFLFQPRKVLLDQLSLVLSSDDSLPESFILVNANEWQGQVNKGFSLITYCKQYSLKRLSLHILQLSIYLREKASIQAMFWSWDLSLTTFCVKFSLGPYHGETYVVITTCTIMHCTKLIPAK